MPVVKLTKTVADKAAPKRDVDGCESDQFFWDVEVRGFGLRVKPAPARSERPPTKSFLIRYTLPDGTARRHTLGQFGQLTVDQARELAKSKLAALLIDGVDPAAERKAARKSATVAEIGDAFHAMVKAESKAVSETPNRKSDYARKPKTLTADEYRLAVLKRSTIADERAATITTEALQRATYPGIKRNRDSAPTRAFDRRMMGWISTMFVWAVGEGLRADNPAAGLTAGKDRKRKFRLDADGYQWLGRALAVAERDGLGDTSHNGNRAPWQAVLAVRALALSGCRRDEILTLRKHDIGFNSGVLRLRDTKSIGVAAARDGETDDRHVGTEVLAILRHALALAEQTAGVDRNDPYVFPDARGAGKHYSANALGKWFRAALRDRPAALKGLSIHGFRHSFISTADDIELSDVTKGLLVGHAKKTQTEDYSHKTAAQLRNAADKVSGAIAAWLMYTGDPAGT
ncbi:integrase family protein [Bradyrhizobium manausense]|uniref:Tyr recombinase domain-containing protein n=1 Tax=Bradyrhizobium manausense TaxID=989370 RepID=A0A0R3D0U8_9BRAD|nr:integrase family protein [Bradyrhizobium manausense]KRQ03297.1 hypothetical protein AOQ71_31715 [Bradyrhizobium manausense]